MRRHQRIKNDALDGQRPWLATVLAAVLLTVREDMGVTLIAVALVMALRRFWPQAALVAVLGVLGYWFATSVVIPHYSPTGDFGYWQFQALGPQIKQVWLSRAKLARSDHPASLNRMLDYHIEDTRAAQLALQRFRAR